jgi:hypothetical protein
MSEVWGQLAKSAVDAEKIEEAIERLIAEHNADSEAHLDEGGSLFSHKASEIIDHLASSIIADKLNILELSDISGDMGDLIAGTLTLDSAGHIKAGQTSYNSGVGFWLGYTGGLENSHVIDLEEDSNQYLKITDAAQNGLDLSSNCSFEFWMKMEQLPSSYVGMNPSVAILFKWAYEISITSANKLSAVFYDGTRYRWFTADTAFSAGDVGVWKHIAITYDLATDTCIFYVNDDVVANTPGGTALIGSLANTGADVSIGYNPNSGQTFDGKLDDFRIWSDVRTEEEVVAYYMTEIQGAEINLEAYWKFNDDALDETDNSNDLTLVNSPVYDSEDLPFTKGSDTYKFSIGNPNGSFMTWNGFALSIGNIFLYNLKSGATQAAAGAAAGEVWATSGHDDLPDDVLMIGR